jgi:serine/threonine protein kinase
VILYECLVGRTIDNGRHMSEVFAELEMQGIPYPSHVSGNARQIISWCLNKNPKNRPTCL